MSKPPAVFLDSSVILAAAISTTGASHAIIVLAEIGFIRPLVSSQVLEEVERNLKAKTPRALPYFDQLAAALNWEIAPEPTAEAIAACARASAPKDAPILAAAMAVKPARLLTLDAKHLNTPEAKAISKLAIQSPAEFVEEMRAILAAAYGPTENGD